MLVIAEARIIEVGGGIELKKARHAVVQREIGDKAAENDVARMTQREDDASVRKDAADERQEVHRQWVLVDESLARRERGQFRGAVEIGLAGRPDLLVAHGRKSF